MSARSADEDNRRLAVLQELAGHLGRAGSPAEACSLALAALAGAGPDIVTAGVHLRGRPAPEGANPAVRHALERALHGPVEVGDTASCPVAGRSGHALLLPLPALSGSVPGPLGVLVLGTAGAPDPGLRAFLDAAAALTAALVAGPAGGPTAVPESRVPASRDPGSLVVLERATARRLALLQQATAELSAAATPDQVVEVGRRHLAGLLATPAVAVWELDGPVLRAAAMDGWIPGVVRDWATVAVDGATPVAEAVRTHRVVLVEGPRDWSRRYPQLGDGPAAGGYPGLAVWPLVVAGSRIGALAVGFTEPHRRLDDEERATASALAEQCGQALARARLLQAESEARRHAVRLGTALAALSEARGLAGVATVLVAQAMLAGAVAAVVVLRPAGDPSANRSGDPLTVVASAGFPPDAPRRLPADGTLTALRSEPDWDVAAGEWDAPEESYPVRSVLPLQVAGRGVGVLGLVWEGDPPGPDERSLLLTVAGQGAQALDRARLQQAEHEVAVTLQRVLLPAASPGLDRLAVATRYRPAGSGTQAGGDWYDVIPLADGRVAIAVGDVVGHGPRAAAVMGQLRSALAAYLIDDHGPAAALERLDRFAARVEGAAASTVACGVLDRDSGELCWARAGHVPALVVDRTGGRFLTAGSGTVLGVRGRPPFGEERVVLDPGASVILYTDGLVERRGEDVDDGLDRLRAAAADVCDHSPELLATALLERCLGEGTADDVALVVIRLLPSPLVGRHVADPALLAPLRREVRRWALEAALPADQLADLQLALGEAVTNAAEHAYLGRPPGIVDYRVTARIDGGVEAEVRDDGRWRPPPADPGHRGRGLLIIDRLAGEVTVRGSAGGTVVRFVMPPLPPSSPPP